MSDSDDYLFLEPLLVERIRAQVPGLADVLAIPDLASLDEDGQVSPSVYVVYLGDDTGSGAPHQGGARKIQTVTQNWAAVLHVYYADATGRGEGARREAGPLLGKLLTELTGWMPDGCTTPLARAPRQAPVAYSNGHFYYPLVFEASFVYPRLKTWKP
ncbi:phage tail terminator protein [Ectopseudomonas oleovorans]|uniref:Uncharacterized protein n=1 Tax=Ectopseudomonas oleovorans (strain CECT 5344) TaxID=1182590 RepID=W6R2B6_ECTO5|nr:hypothetical protein [Pseudomonas oleovorans]CDM42388.1 hypothetical protein BN5_3846 [Pseudomonas oleovorans CECT 5344]CDR93011.1 hypothetical protein PPSAL_3787 [Pseudomonas oleovorans]